MTYDIRMGLPEMDALWRNLTRGHEQGTLTRVEMQFCKKLVKTLGYLRTNPRHPSLQTHDTDALTKRYGFKVWQSYLETNKPAAGRLFWTYGPGQQEITILAIEPHPEDQKRGAYERIKLSELPPLGTTGARRNK